MASWTSTSSTKFRKEQVERAFLLGMAGMAAVAFSIREEQETLFLKNILGNYLGLGPGEVEVEIDAMYSAADKEKHACDIGGRFLVDCCLNGKREEFALTLAKLLQF